jgi:hypothetical protein
MRITHAVDAAGLVYCAQQHKRIDVLSCYGCERLVDIDIDSRHPKVTCEVERPAIEDRGPATRSALGR